MMVDLLTRAPATTQDSCSSPEGVASPAGVSALTPPTTSVSPPGTMIGSVATPVTGTPTVAIGGSEGLAEALLRATAFELPLTPLSSDNRTNQKWEPKELKPRHREMMRRILEGASYIDIAEALGISPQSVMLVASSAIFKSELSAMESALDSNVIRRAEDLSHEALDKLKTLMRHAKAEALQASCAERVLGIAGYSKIEKKQIAVVSGEDVIRELNRRRRDADDAFRVGVDTGPTTTPAIEATAEEL